MLFQVGEIEPLFCSLAIWNLEHGRKVTEDFHFDFNSDKVLSMLKLVRASIAPELQPQRALFTLPPKTALGDPNYYFVLFVDALWCEDPDEKLKTYYKGAVRLPLSVSASARSLTRSLARSAAVEAQGGGEAHDRAV